MFTNRPASALRRALTASAALVLLTLFAAPAAHAAFSAWSSSIGLSANPGPSWVRVYAHGTPGTIYAGSEGDGVYVSASNGLSWTPLNGGLSSPEAKHIRAILYAGGKTYAGTQAGLFVLSGATWSPLAQGAGPEQLPYSVQALAAPSPTVLLAGTFGHGVASSADGGSTWTPAAAGNGMPAADTVWSLSKIGPLVFAATSDGIYRSADSGKTWTLTSDGIPESATTLRVLVDGANPNILYAATGGDGVYRSINFGTTWSSISTGLGSGTVRGLESVPGPTTSRLYAATADGLWAGTTGNGPVPGPVVWRKVTQNGLGGNTIFWAIDAFTAPNVLLAGTQSNGGYTLTFEAPANISVPTVGGASLTVGRTMSASAGSWVGTGVIGYAYQWQRCLTANVVTCADIAGATDLAYNLTDSEQNKYVRVKVTALNDFPDFVPHATYSAVAGPLAANPLNLPGANQFTSPFITMTGSGNLSLPNVGDTLKANAGVINPVAASVAFQWLRCSVASDDCLPIAGATSSTYTIQTADAALRIAVRETATNVAGSSTAPDSGTTNLVIPDPAAPLTAPALHGDAVVGNTLVGGVGSWKSGQTTFERQWERCDADGTGCNAIISASDPGYVVQEQDRGYRLRLRVTADVNESYKLPGAVVVYTATSAVVPYPTVTDAGGPGSGQPAPPSDGTSDAGPQVPADRTAPVVSGLRIAASRHQRTVLGFRLSEAGTMTIVVQRPAAGRRSGARCLAPSQRLRKAKKCTRYAKVTAIDGPVQAGPGAVTLGATVGGKALRPGRYRLLVTVRDAAGNVSSTSAVAVKRR